MRTVTDIKELRDFLFSYLDNASIYSLWVTCKPSSQGWKLSDVSPHRLPEREFRIVMNYGITGRGTNIPSSIQDCCRQGYSSLLTYFTEGVTVSQENFRLYAGFAFYNYKAVAETPRCLYNYKVETPDVIDSPSSYSPVVLLELLENIASNNNCKYSPHTMSCACASGNKALVDYLSRFIFDGAALTPTLDHLCRAIELDAHEILERSIKRDISGVLEFPIERNAEYTASKITRALVTSRALKCIDILAARQFVIMGYEYVDMSEQILSAVGAWGDLPTYKFILESNLADRGDIVLSSAIKSSNFSILDYIYEVNAALDKEEFRSFFSRCANHCLEKDAPMSVRWLLEKYGQPPRNGVSALTSFVRAMWTSEMRRRTLPEMFTPQNTRKGFTKAQNWLFGLRLPEEQRRLVIQGVKRDCLSTPVLSTKALLEGFLEIEDILDCLDYPQVTNNSRQNFVRILLGFGFYLLPYKHRLSYLSSKTMALVREVKHKTVRLFLKEGTIMVDQQLLPLLTLLGTAGIRILSSCQGNPASHRGNPSPLGYITFSSMEDMYKFFCVVNLKGNKFSGREIARQQTRSKSKITRHHDGLLTMDHVDREGLTFLSPDNFPLLVKHNSVANYYSRMAGIFSVRFFNEDIESIFSIVKDALTCLSNNQ